MTSAHHTAPPSVPALPAPRPAGILRRATPAAVALTLFAVLTVSADAQPVPSPLPLRTATFAGGCFWCMEPPFDALPGVVATIAGYTGGAEPQPSYEQVAAGKTGHAEAVQVVYDPGRVSYETLLDVFWRNIDPLTPDRQFCDVGRQYRSAIFCHDDEQRRAAEASRRALEASGRLPGPVVTEIAPAGPFYPAESYHQDYYRTHPVRYA